MYNGRLILASASPRRKELLADISTAFEIVPSNVEEEELSRKLGEVTPRDLAIALASAKAADVHAHNPGSVVIGADTIVVLDDTVLNKPIDTDDAFRMLSMLSGRTHEVFTGIAVVTDKAALSDAGRTLVTFRTLSPEDIKSYIATGEPMDKAGAYGIQNKDISPVASIEGDYYNVVGLPIEKLRSLLDKLIPRLDKP